MNLHLLVIIRLYLFYIFIFTENLEIVRQKRTRQRRTVQRRTLQKRGNLHQRRRSKKKPIPTKEHCSRALISCLVLNRPRHQTASGFTAQSATSLRTPAVRRKWMTMEKENEQPQEGLVPGNVSTEACHFMTLRQSPRMPLLVLKLPQHNSHKPHSLWLEPTNRWDRCTFWGNYWRGTISFFKWNYCPITEVAFTSDSTMI